MGSEARVIDRGPVGWALLLMIVAVVGSKYWLQVYSRQSVAKMIVS